MDIIRATVPGNGIVYHFLTRDGQRFGVLADDSGRRRLLIYDPDGLDIPLQTIVMEQDEADQVAEVLHSRPVPDRLAVLERRLAEMTGEAP